MPLYRWSLQTGRTSLQRFVDALTGRLLSKAPQLDVVREYLLETAPAPRGRNPVPEEEMRRRWSYFERVRALNQRHNGTAKQFARFSYK